ncbi:MAG TPA: tRNA-dihydrouridine synthase, partial [Vicinamibacteria bacterium]|nr:tRNA-dihydrouridine synthase [Vicinamibacteria bacterium]
EARAGAVIEKMVKRSKIPVTVKIRSGWDHSSINAPSFARALEAAGASAITVHPRCRSEHHRGEAAWSVIRDVKQAVSIPVVGNGDVRCPESARSMIEVTGADGIMIGRGALQNPWVFRQIATGSAEAPELDDYRRLFERFVALLREHRPERLVLNRVKAFIGWVTKGLESGSRLRESIYAAKSIEEALSAFDRYFDQRNR